MVSGLVVQGGQKNLLTHLEPKDSLPVMLTKPLGCENRVIIGDMFVFGLMTC